MKCKKARAAIAKRTPEQGRKKMVASNKPAAAPKANQAGPCPQQMDLGERLSHVVRGGRTIKASDPKPIPQPVNEAPNQPQMSATQTAAKPEKTEPKTTTALKAAGGKPKKSATTSAKPVAATQVVANTHPTSSTIEGISDLDNLPLEACVVLIRRLLTSFSFLPKRAARPQNRDILRGRKWQHAPGGRFVVKSCASPARMRTISASRSLNWSILSANTVSICLLIATFLNHGEAFRLANYVCHGTNKPTAGGGKAILVRRGVAHHTVPVLGLTQLETTAIQIVLAGRPVKVLAA